MNRFRTSTRVQELVLQTSCPSNQRLNSVSKPVRLIVLFMPLTFLRLCRRSSSAVAKQPPPSHLPQNINAKERPRPGIKPNYFELSVSIPPPRLRARRTRRAARTRLHLEPLLRRQLQLALQLGTGILAVNKIAEPAAHTSFARVQSTACLAKICYRTQLAVDWPRGVPPRVEVLAGLGRVLLVLEASVHVADQVVVVVVADDKLLELTVFAHLAPDVLIEGVEVVLQLLLVHAALGVVRRVLVEVRHEDRLRVGWLDVLATAAVAVAAGADFVVEGAVDLVLLGAED